MASDRYQIRTFSLLGKREWQVYDPLDPDGRLKESRPDVDEDTFDTEAEAQRLAGRLNSR